MYAIQIQPGAPTTVAHINLDPGASRDTCIAALQDAAVQLGTAYEEATIMWVADFAGVVLEVEDANNRVSVRFRLANLESAEPYNQACALAQAIVAVTEELRTSGQEVFLEWHGPVQEKAISFIFAEKCIAEKRVVQLIYVFPDAWQKEDFSRVVQQIKVLLGWVDKGKCPYDQTLKSGYVVAIWRLGRDLPADTVGTVIMAARDKQMNSLVQYTVFVTSTAFVRGMITSLKAIADKFAKDLSFGVASETSEEGLAIAGHLAKAAKK